MKCVETGTDIQRYVLHAVADRGWRNGRLSELAAKALADPRSALAVLDPRWIKKIKKTKGIFLHESLMPFVNREEIDAQPD